MKEFLLKDSIISIEVKLLKKEGFLNLLANNKVFVKNVRNVDAVTLRCDIRYSDYKELKKLVKRLKGKVKIVSRGKLLLFFLNAKGKASFLFGSVALIAIFFIMSKFVWRIEIEGKTYLPPYEIRLALKELGVEPGVSKNKINVYDLEKKIENAIDEIMWINIRIEGGTMNVKYEEKKATLIQEDSNIAGKEKIASMDGEIKRIYTSSGTAKVKVGDIVKKGDTLIVGEQIIKDPLIDGESIKKTVKSDGVIIANTFYEKIVEVQTSGNIEERTGNIQKDIVLNLLGKKIYLKKANKDFVSYDKIEKNGRFINKNIYYEKVEKEIGESKEEIVKQTTQKLRKSVENEISKQAIIIDEIVELEEIGDGMTKIKVLFVVEQDIVSLN
ncbi:MAG: sporulation protein YqfD [Sarcina sp.]